MSDARDRILGGLRRALGAQDRADRSDAVEARMAARARGTVPARVDRDAAGLQALFVEQATAAAATVEPLAEWAEVPAAVARFLAGHNLPSRIKAAPDPELAAIDWSLRPALEVTRGRGEIDDVTSVTGCFAAVAETGTLVLVSGAERPATLNFVPDNHVVVLRRSQVVGCYEDAWDRLRAHGAGLPRTVNFVTGPSRTADIEQKVQLGAHGPRRLHILLVDA